LFFFSSRRRHTRFSRDWSSDVCSSDLTGAGLLDPVTTALWAFSGAVAANWASYNLGRKIGPRVYRSWPLNRDRTMVARARLFFRRYGFAAVFLSRFLGPMRAVVPAVAGVDRKSTRLNSSHVKISYAVFCLKKKNQEMRS